MSVQVEPLSTDPYSSSPLTRPVLNVAVIVCDAVFVLKSIAELPVSALISRPLIVTVGLTVSTTCAAAFASDAILFPERSVKPAATAVTAMSVVLASGAVTSSV